MKTIKGLLIGVLALSGTYLHATETDPYFNVRVTGSRTMTLSIRNVSENATVRLQDEQGQVVYSEEVTPAGEFVKSFDLNELPNGNYTLEYKDDFKVQTAMINIAEKLEAEYAGLYFLPVIAHKENIISVAKVTNGKEKIAVSIYSDNGDLLFSTVISGEEFFGKRFDFSKAPKGNYSVYVSGNGHTVQKNIELK